ncbi:hypothetical protein D3C79_691260 [compost metagenome]
MAIYKTENFIFVKKDDGANTQHLCRVSARLGDVGRDGQLDENNANMPDLTLLGRALLSGDMSVRDPCH